MTKVKGWVEKLDRARGLVELGDDAADTLLTELFLEMDAWALLHEANKQAIENHLTALERDYGNEHDGVLKRTGKIREQLREVGL